LNEAAAQTNLGFMCERGLAQQPNAEEAFRWYKAAAKQNEVTAHWNLSVCYRAGTGCKQNLLMSIEHLRAVSCVAPRRRRVRR
jgi:TPR repeat protein